MRMWNVEPKYLCRKHLLGEHVEMHMFIGSIEKGISLAGYVKNNLIETDRISLRHDELVVEMTDRGYNHKSPVNNWECSVSVGKVNVKANLKELSNRCPDCKKRIKEAI